MKLVVVMPPGDVATYLETVQTQLAGLEELAPEALEERLAQIRAWLAASASQLRSVDPRGKLATAQPRAPAGSNPGATLPSTGPELRPATAPVKKPCDCEEKLTGPTMARALAGRVHETRAPLSWRMIGEAVARRLFG